MSTNIIPYSRRKGITCAAKGPQGFTLIEVLIAVALTAVVASIIYAALISLLTNRERLEKKSNIYHSGEIVLSLMSDEISAAFLSRKEDRKYFVGEHVMNFDRPQDKLNFTSFANFQWVKDEKESDQCEVGYFVRDMPENKTNYLIRRHSPVIDDNPGEGGVEEELLENIYSLQLRYYNGKEWVEEWDAKSQGVLPEAVEITLELKDLDDKIVKFSTIAGIPIQP